MSSGLAYRMWDCCALVLGAPPPNVLSRARTRDSIAFMGPSRIEEAGDKPQRIVAIEAESTFEVEVIVYFESGEESWCDDSGSNRLRDLNLVRLDEVIPEAVLHVAGLSSLPVFVVPATRKVHWCELLVDQDLKDCLQKLYEDKLARRFIKGLVQPQDSANNVRL